MRARLAIASAGMHCALREILLRNKPEHMLQISPKGTVPVLELTDGAVVDESVNIAIWALKEHDPEHLLNPIGASEAEMLALISTMDNSFKPLLDRYKYRFHAEPDAAKSARDDATFFLRELNERLEGQNFLFGDRISFADLCILPFVRQFAHVDKDWFWAQDFASVIAWLDAFLDSDRFAAIMQKFAVWQPGDELSVFPPALISD